jgi:pimeloyl-ACP methyl ester carboxylesterase
VPISSINGVQLYWELSGGAGEPAVLVHGSWGDHFNWAQVVPALSASLNVATYDRRGHSRSDRPIGQGSIQEDVADLAALIEVLFARPAHVIGNSFGASIALNLAVRRPELIRSLTAHEPPLFCLLEGDSQVQPTLSVVQERIAAVVRILEGGDVEGGARRFVETVAFGPGAWDWLPPSIRDTFVFNAPTWLDELRDPAAMSLDLGRASRCSAPVLLTLGGESPPYFPAVVERIAAALPHARRHLFPQAGHLPHLTHAEEYVQVITDFVSSGSVSRG